jgi:hypothetical protein
MRGALDTGNAVRDDCTRRTQGRRNGSGEKFAPTAIDEVRADAKASGVNPRSDDQSDVWLELAELFFLDTEHDDARTRRSRRN